MSAILLFEARNLVFLTMVFRAQLLEHCRFALRQQPCSIKKMMVISSFYLFGLTKESSNELIRMSQTRISIYLALRATTSTDDGGSCLRNRVLVHLFKCASFGFP